MRAALAIAATLIVASCAPVLGEEELAERIEAVVQFGEGERGSVRLGDIFGADIRAVCSVHGYAGAGEITSNSDPSVDLSGLLTRMSVRAGGSDETDIYVFDTRGRLREQYALGASSHTRMTGHSACRGPDTVVEVSGERHGAMVTVPRWQDDVDSN